MCTVHLPSNSKAIVFIRWLCYIILPIRLPRDLHRGQGTLPTRGGSGRRKKSLSVLTASVVVFICLLTLSCKIAARGHRTHFGRHRLDYNFWICYSARSAKSADSTWKYFDVVAERQLSSAEGDMLDTMELDPGKAADLMVQGDGASTARPAPPGLFSWKRP